jgi:hypothetical protein
VRSATIALLRILNPGNTKPANCLEKWDDVESAFVQRASYVSPILAGNVRSVFAEMKAEISAQSLKGFEWEGANPFIYGYESEIPVQRLEPYWRVLRSMRSVDADALGAIMSNASAAGGGQPVVEVPIDDDGENEI